MKRLAQLVLVMLFAVLAAVPVMADVAPEPSPVSSDSGLFYILIAVVVIAAAVLFYVLKKRKK